MDRGAARPDRAADRLDLRGALDLVFLAVKSQDTEAALDTPVPLCPLVCARHHDLYRCRTG